MKKSIKDIEKDDILKGIIMAALMVVYFGIFILIMDIDKNLSENKTVTATVDLNNGWYTIISENTIVGDNVDEHIHYYIAYDNNTKVMYTIGKAEGAARAFTVMVRDTGKPRYYKGN